MVTLDHDWVPDQDPNWSTPVRSYLEAWSHNMSVALTPSMDPASVSAITLLTGTISPTCQLTDCCEQKNGVFNPACYIHTSFSPSGPLLDGLNFLQAFDRW